MINKRVAANCMSGYATGERKPFLLFPEDEEFRKKWVYFVNRKNCGHRQNILLQVSITSMKNL